MSFKIRLIMVWKFSSSEYSFRSQKQQFSSGILTLLCSFAVCDDGRVTWVMFLCAARPNPDVIRCTNIAESIGLCQHVAAVSRCKQS